jgi:hypothetical protein
MEAWLRAGMIMARTPLVQTIAAPIEFASAVTCYRDAHNSERPASTMRATARASFPLPYSRTPPYCPAFRFCATDFSLARATSGAKPCDIWKGSRWPARDETTQGSPHAQDDRPLDFDQARSRTKRMNIVSA